MEQYINLNTRSNYTAYETVITPEDIVEFAFRNGAAAVALTDKNSVLGFPYFSKAAAKYKGFKPIYGVQLDCLIGECDPILITLLAKNQTGIRNMYKIITAGYMELRETNQWPCVSIQDVDKNREGLLVGMDLRWTDIHALSVAEMDFAAVYKNLKFADYIGIRPWDQNPFTSIKYRDVDENRLSNTAIEIISHLEQEGKFPIAVNCSNCISKDDELCFDILSNSRPITEDRNKALMKSTRETLRDYQFLGKELAEQLVIKNPNILAGQISEDIVIGEPRTVLIKIPDAMQTLKKQCNDTLAKKYGSNPPEEIRKRLDKELGFIQKSDVASYYVLASMLARKSDELGCIHTVRGCAGGSFVAHLMQITETNPLPPHYYCPVCGSVEFVDEVAFPSGYDLIYSKKKRFCPKCGAPMTGDGQNIPCEFFMGYYGEKIPDFDLNFSEEIIQDIIDCLDETFGKDKVFIAGTIGITSECTATRQINAYCADKGIRFNHKQRVMLTNRLRRVLRYAGRHPGGFVIVPEDKDIYDFCPLGFIDRRQLTEASRNKPVTQIEYNRLPLDKIDVLCHSISISLKQMERISGISAKSIDIDQINISEFFSNDSLTGLPFHTYLKNLIEIVKPTTYSELVKISGFAHGTNVWYGNAKDLLCHGHKVSDTIAFREDVMLYLLQHGIEYEDAFSIAEKVRKGIATHEHGLSEKEKQSLKEHDIPDWYVQSMKKIRYLFPKSHSDGYVKNNLRMVWYKIYCPEAYYASALSTNEAIMDYGILTEGISRIKQEIHIMQPELELALKKDYFDDRKIRKIDEALKIGIECYDAGIAFLPADINKSEPVLFTVENGAIRIPFNLPNRLSEEQCKLICRE